MVKQAEPVALVDLDGTLCDFDGEMMFWLRMMAASGEEVDAEGYTKQAHIKARWNVIKSIPGFWEYLKPLKIGFDIFNLLGELKFNRHILTKGPVKTIRAWTEKAAWCRKNVPDTPVTISEDKGLVYGKVLVDDWPEYYNRWLEWRPRGLVIVPAQRWNKDVDHPNCIRYDGTNLKEVKERLVKIRATAGDC